MADEYDLAATLVTKLQSGEPGSLVLTATNALSSDQMSEQSKRNSLQFLSDLENVEDGFRMPFEEPLTHEDLMRHHRLPSDAVSVEVARRVGQRMNEEVAGATVMMNLDKKDQAENKFRSASLPPLKKEPKQPESVRQSVLKAIKSEGF